MRIAIFGNTYQGAYAHELRRFFDGLRRYPDIALEFEPSYRDYLLGLLGAGSLPPARRGCCPDEVDLVISIGGDGTFLHTANSVGEAETPIMGLNSGHLGYLSAAPITDVDKVITDIIEGRYIVEPRSMLQVSTPDSHRLPRRPFALNEIAVMREATASMISVDTRIDGEPLATYLGDGLIIATPTGSTAYNLSAGGPILAPTAPSWVITPVAPHSLTMRPLVVSDRTRIEITARSRSNTFTVAIDGNPWTLPIGSTVTVSRAAYVTNVVRLPGHTFIDSLREKLLWGAAGK
ncbi:MAG: NAD(+)/NADH kinase [Paramuribaculum sp.]|nr:NAD kinase [Bacteroides sp.]MDE7461345.1 NAD(+)/NADH kinase [Paramuribaculum sp.]